MDNPRIALITGGSRGIGAATARLFASRGFAVCINYKSNADAAREVEQAITRDGGRCLSVRADLAIEAEVLQLFATVDRELGPLGVLVNNAGMLLRQCRLDAMSAERISTIFANNVLSCFLCCREAVRRMSTRQGGTGGTIVNVSSVAARTGSPNEYVDYASAKGAIDTLTRGLALEVAGEGIRVNCVRPGLIHTGIHADGGEPGRIERLRERIPLKRGGTPEEVAEAIFWLASERSSYATGSFLDLAGGL